MIRCAICGSGPKGCVAVTRVAAGCSPMWIWSHWFLRNTRFGRFGSGQTRCLVEMSGDFDALYARTGRLPPSWRGTGHFLGNYIAKCRSAEDQFSEPDPVAKDVKEFLNTVWETHKKFTGVQLSNCTSQNWNGPEWVH